MADGLRRGGWISVCLLLIGCRTPDCYGPGLEMAAPPPLNVVRVDGEASVPPAAPPAESVPSVDPHASAVRQASAVIPAPTAPGTDVPQTLPAALLEPLRVPHLTAVRDLLQQAQTRMDSIDSYMVRIRRREVMNGRALPEDLLLCKIRRQPLSVYMKSIGHTAHEGREAVYVAGKNPNKMHVRTGKGDILAGICLELDPHSARATANSRRTIDEAGLANLLGRIVKVLHRVEAGQTQETLTYLGTQSRPESRTPLEGIAQTLLPNQEKLLPHGGRRLFFFNKDPQSAEYHLPVLVITEDETGREVEYYFYDRLCPNIGLSERDFDPEVIWGK